MNAITLHEVEVSAHNAAFIANCACPSRYRCTEWQQIWRNLRKAKIAELMSA